MAVYEYKCEKCGGVSELYVPSPIQIPPDQVQQMNCQHPGCDGKAKRIVSRLGAIVRIGGGWGGQ